MVLKRKGQLTLFIIIGSLIVIIVGILIYSAKTKEEAEKAPILQEVIEFPAELKPLGNFVQVCLEKESKNTINITAIQGGRPLAPRHAYEWNSMTLSHGYYYGLNEIPTLEEMQDEMAGHLSIHLNDCLNNLQSFKDKGMNLVTGEISPRFEVGSDAVLVELNYPITLKKETGDVSVERFSVAIPSRLGYLHDAARKIVAEDVRTGGKVGFSYTSQFQVSFDIYSVDEFFFILEMYDAESIKNYITKSFYFVNNYNQNHNPIIKNVDNVVANIGEDISFYVISIDEDSDEVIYSDDSELFDINPTTGLVQFTPQVSGRELVEIQVDDKKGGHDTEIFQIDIV